MSLPFDEESVPTDAGLRIAQAQLVGWCPVHVAGLTAGPRCCLFDGPLDRDDDVAEVRSLARWQRERIGRSAHEQILARMLGEGRGRQQREREHIGRPGLAHVGFNVLPEHLGGALVEHELQSVNLLHEAND